MQREAPTALEGLGAVGAMTRESVSAASSPPSPGNLESDAQRAAVLQGPGHHVVATPRTSRAALRSL